MSKENFTKARFAKIMADRYAFALEEGERFYDVLGKELQQCLLSGGSVRLFGNGALKVVCRADESVRVRFRPSPGLSALIANVPGDAVAREVASNSEDDL
jgi:hypothetical protein